MQDVQVQVTLLGVIATVLIEARVKAFPCSSIKARVFVAKVIAGAWVGQAYLMTIPWKIMRYDTLEILVIIHWPIQFSTIFLPTNSQSG